MRDVGKVKERADYMGALYGPRDLQYELNWYAYCGEWDKIDYLARTNSRLDDGRRRRQDRYQNWNILKPVVDHTIMVLSRPPSIQVPSADAKTEAAIDKARKIEYGLYGLWDASGMDQQCAVEGFNLGCFGSSVSVCLPDFETKRPRFAVRPPGHCYPVPKANGIDFAYVIFRWMEDLEMLTWRYPHLKDSLSGKGGRYRKGQVEVLEYIDDKDYGLIVEGEWHPGQPGYSHDWGFVPVTVTPALKLPGNNLFGPSDIDQLIAINILMNGLQTKIFDAMEEGLYPSRFTTGPTDPVIDNAPGQWQHLPEGTQVIETKPPSVPPDAFLLMERATSFVRTHANWSEVWSGELNSSMATGKAISKLQGPAAGMAALRQSFMAASWQRQNRFALRMLEKVWPDEELELEVGGMNSANSAPGRPTNKLVMLRPKEDIDGYYRNNVSYSSFGADFASTSQQVQQLVAAGMASKTWGRKQLPGMDDEEGMREEIEREKHQDLKLEMDLQFEMEKRMSEMRVKEAEQMQALQAGGAPGGAAGGAAPPGAPGSGPGGVALLPQGQPQAMGIGEPLGGEENFPLPYTDVKPFPQALEALAGGGRGGPAPAGPGGQPPTGPEEVPAAVKETDPRAVDAEAVIAAIKGIAKRIASGEIRSRSGGIKGAVYLLGDIAQRGMTMGNIEVGFTVASDRQLLESALTEWNGRLRFMKVTSDNPPAGAQLVMEGGSSAVPEQTQEPAA
jgi:hypothetical protein